MLRPDRSRLCRSDQLQPLRAAFVCSAMSLPPQPHTNNSDQPQVMRTATGVEYTLLPRDSGIILNGWRIERHKGPISNSAELDDFQSRSSIHCPEMSFLSNHLTLTRADSGVSIVFEAKEALKACSHTATAAQPEGKPGASSSRPSSVASVAPAKLQVASASKWNPKMYEGLVEGGVKQIDHGFDWTYTTKYKGEVISAKSASAASAVSDSSAAAAAAVVESTNDEIPLAMLQRPEPILWYDSIPLFEDELHDNGVASLTVKIRVMESCVLVLMQFWLRVDQILLRVYDTRLFHAFGDDAVIREQTRREDTFDELAKRGMPRTPSMYADPSAFGRRLTLQATEREKITFSKAAPQTDTTTTSV